jgi:hypothetical protein
MGIKNYHSKKTKHQESVTKNKQTWSSGFSSTTVKNRGSDEPPLFCSETTSRRNGSDGAGSENGNHQDRSPASKTPEKTVRRGVANSFAQPRRKRNFRTSLLQRKGFRCKKVHVTIFSSPPCGHWPWYPTGKRIDRPAWKEGLSRVTDIALRPVLFAGMFVVSPGLYHLSLGMLIVLIS